MKPYENVNAMLLEISLVDKIDFFNENTPIPRAVKWGVRMMTVIAKSENLAPTVKEMKEISEALKEKGAVNFEQYKQVSTRFVQDKNVGEAMKDENNMAFPLGALAQLVDTKPYTFKIGLSKASDGGMEYSWAASWIKAQQAPIKENTKTPIASKGMEK